MTFEQLTIFIAVAEREHVTRAAEVLHLTPSTVSAAIRKLEDTHGIELFNRVGRGLVLTSAGRNFLPEARETLARMRRAERMLADLGSLQAGSLTISASQTIASYWLPPVLMRFHETYPGIELSLSILNTAGVAKTIRQGEVEIGFVEGELDDPLIGRERLLDDAMNVVTAPEHPFADGHPLGIRDLIEETSWIMRESGSGTRSAFESALIASGQDLEDLRIALEMPSNEAVLSAVLAGKSASALSQVVVAPYLAQGGLVRANISLPKRAFFLLHHRERPLSRAAKTLADMCREHAADSQ